jgi:hypothetical protein
MGACKLTNVWWSAVCEDAFTIKKQEAGDTTTISGGGAFGAEDKVLQHNGGGTMEVSGFTVDNFGKLYRSCGNCKTQAERHVIFSDITASEGKTLAGESRSGSICLDDDESTDVENRHKLQLRRHRHLQGHQSQRRQGDLRRVHRH